MTFAQEQLEGPDSAQRPSRHAIIMRGIVAPILGMLAITAIIFGVLNATIWKPDARVSASASISGSQYVVTDPGVLRLIDDRTQLHVSAPGDGQVCIALGAPKDVAGWIAGHGYTRLTGLADWTTLSTVPMKAQGTAKTSDADVSVKDSDMWSSVRCGSSSADIRADSGQSTDVALIDLGADSGKATVTMRAVRQTTPDFAMPLYFVGGLLVVLMVLAASVFAIPSHKRRKRHVSSRAVETSEEVAISEAFTGSIRGLTSVVKIKPQGGSRHKRHAGHAGSPVSGGTAVEGEGTASSSPTVIDPLQRNLVADAQAQATSDESGTQQPEHAGQEAGTEAGSVADNESHESDSDASAQTSVISPDELQAYFARLSQEMGESEDGFHDDEGDHGVKTNGDVADDGADDTAVADDTSAADNADTARDAGRTTEEGA